MLTSDTITEEGATTTVQALLAPSQIVSTVTIDTVVEQFGLEVVETIDTRRALFAAVDVHAVLAEVCVHDQVAVLCKTCVVNVFRVLVCPFDEQILCWNSIP